MATFKLHQDLKASAAQHEASHPGLWPWCPQKFGCLIGRGDLQLPCGDGACSASMLRRLQGLQNMVRCAARARTGGIALGSGVASEVTLSRAAQRLAPPLAKPNELFHCGFSRLWLATNRSVAARRARRLHRAELARRRRRALDVRLSRADRSMSARPRR